MRTLPLKDLLTCLKATAEPTRLRILVLLAAGELTVKDLTRILGQSQPRISRHLKLLAEAGLIERAPEGSWVYFRLAEGAAPRTLLDDLLARVDATENAVARDRQRADAVKREREAAAQAYFEKHASEWDRIRALHIDEAEVEAQMLAAFGPREVDLLVDVGTGTGRMLEVFAGRYKRALGFDLSPAMLAYARAKHAHANLPAQVRQADIYDLPLGDGQAGAVVLHQVLHFLSDPVRAIEEAARVLAPGGRLLIADFAAHDVEFLRDRFAHERLGFQAATVEQWLTDAGLTVHPTRVLAPAPAGDDARLTVLIWTGERASVGASRGGSASRPKTLERIT